MHSFNLILDLCLLNLMIFRLLDQSILLFTVTDIISKCPYTSVSIIFFSSLLANFSRNSAQVGVSTSHLLLMRLSSHTSPTLRFVGLQLCIALQSSYCHHRFTSSLTQLSNNSNSLLRNFCFILKLPDAKQALNVLNLSPQSSYVCSHSDARTQTITCDLSCSRLGSCYWFAHTRSTSVRFFLKLHTAVSLQLRHTAVSPDRNNFTIFLLLSLNQMTRRTNCSWLFSSSFGWG